jgi:CheY-like chemotaxis protein
MATQQKILMLDDDEQMLDLYQELFRQLPSKPEVHVCNSGPRAIAILESEPFNLLITDLRMPKMDGLQVLAIVRRKFPHLRIIVLTGILDEEYRSRAYAQGVEMFWQKPGTSEEVKLFTDGVESVLSQDTQGQGGFRGMQSKSLVDLIQLECLSQSSSVLRVTQGAVEGKIWVQNGDIIDAAAAHFTGEDAFKEILSWKGGNFEILPADPDHVRTIHNSYQGLLLDSAQALDESRGQQEAAEQGAAAQAGGADNPSPSGSVLSPLTRFEGVEFVFTAPNDASARSDSWGLENAPQLAAWARDTHKRLAELGEKFGTGGLNQVMGTGLQRHWALAHDAQKGLLCVGFRRTLAADKVDQTMKHVFTKWVS